MIDNDREELYMSHVTIKSKSVSTYETYLHLQPLL